MRVLFSKILQIIYFIPQLNILHLSFYFYDPTIDYLKIRHGFNIQNEELHLKIGYEFNMKIQLHPLASN